MFTISKKRNSQTAPCVVSRKKRGGGKHNLVSISEMETELCLLSVLLSYCCLKRRIDSIVHLCKLSLHRHVSIVSDDVILLRTISHVNSQFAFAQVQLREGRVNYARWFLVKWTWKLNNKWMIDILKYKIKFLYIFPYLTFNSHNCLCGSLYMSCLMCRIAYTG
jgi:hypothetical protein